VPYVYNPTFVGKGFLKKYIVTVILPAYNSYEDGKDRVFRKAGTQNSDAGEITQKK
jgi:hypothetical protein